MASGGSYVPGTKKRKGLKAPLCPSLHGLWSPARTGVSRTAVASPGPTWHPQATSLPSSAPTMASPTDPSLASCFHTESSEYSWMYPQPHLCPRTCLLWPLLPGCGPAQLSVLKTPALPIAALLNPFLPLPHPPATLYPLSRCECVSLAVWELLVAGAKPLLQL